MPRHAEPVTADDVDLAVRLTLALLGEAPPDAWDAKAGPLEWDRWETVEHMSHALTLYAAQLAPRKPLLDRNVAFHRESSRPGAPSTIVRADRSAGPAGLLEVYETAGSLLAAMLRTTPPDVRAYHVFGVSDPEGFAAMGVVETLVHTHDLVEDLGLAWEPPAGLCARALGRLFPGAPHDTPPWRTLLWSTGRADLPGRPLVTSWQWDGTPAADRGQRR